MFSPPRFRCLADSRVSSLLTLLPLALAVGCASQGPLQPPSLHLPALAEKLTAERVGNQVLLSWTTPPKTTDGDLIKGAISASVCLDATPSSTPPPPPKKGRRNKKAAPTQTPPAACNAVAHLAVTPGPSHTTAEIAAALTSGAPSLVAYSIELENAKGHSAGPSAPVFVAAGSAPPPAAALSISARRESTVIQWKPEPGSSLMELKRTLIATAEGPVPATPPPTPSAAKPPTPFAPAKSKTPPRELVLRPDVKTAKDPGGISDPSVRDGDTYTYVAQRVATVTLEGHTLELRSPASAPITFAYRDTFPPKPPAGLVLVPGGGFGEPPSIDLAWDASFEPDLLGYNVYRGDGDAAFVRINSEPLPSPSYRDLQVEPGRQYTYRVTAIDQRHNESTPSAVASESLRK